MRQTHKAGEKCFVDYFGPTVPIVRPHTDKIRTAQVFVAILGASNYSYTEATWGRSYCLLSVGKAPISVLRAYIENQD